MSTKRKKYPPNKLGHHNFATAHTHAKQKIELPLPNKKRERERRWECRLGRKEKYIKIKTAPPGTVTLFLCLYTKNNWKTHS